ncbi:hypothetical protein BDN70DRAFT_684127 [Pholiota conissans]|uniref:DUF7918 domain-containing protein n=1 Tax=Pholiota conissans TaxID=109636 RepID=A0A9P6D0U6_9AGAR|nr:hypothetical protein BDN70DRAFT_684127 [Pholiota conissans]
MVLTRRDDSMEHDIPTPWLAYGGFEACITVNNTPVNRFGAKYNSDRGGEATAWIPSEANKNFAIYFHKITLDDHDYSMKLYLDGKKVHCSVLKKTSGTKLYRISCVPVSPTETRDFVFNAIEAPDVDTSLCNTSSRIGEIKLVLQPVEIKKQTKPPASSFSPPLEIDLKPEQGARATVQSDLVHQVGYEPQRPKLPSVITDKWLLFLETGEAVNLAFKYRPLEVLQANGIVPRPSEPVNAAVEAIPIVLKTNDRLTIKLPQKADDTFLSDQKPQKSSSEPQTLQWISSLPSNFAIKQVEKEDRTPIRISKKRTADTSSSTPSTVVNNRAYVLLDPPHPSVAAGSSQITPVAVQNRPKKAKIHHPIPTYPEFFDIDNWYILSAIADL